MVASAVVKDDPTNLAESAALIEEAVRRLMPFSQGRISRIPGSSRPLWDDEAAVAGPGSGVGWPGAVEIHTPGRHPVFCLPREGLAGLGLEGELLLGWRGEETLREVSSSAAADLTRNKSRVIGLLFPSVRSPLFV